MSKGFNFDPDAETLTFYNGSRNVAINSGRLFNGLPTELDTTISVSFPDFTKGRAGFWSFTSTYNPLVGAHGQYGWGCTGQTAFTRIKEDWSQNSVIATVPTGADLLISRIRINRTVNPTHTWFEKTLAVRPKVNAWLPFAGGTVIVESGIGMMRAFSLDIVGSELILNREQTCGPKTHGYGSSGASTPATGANTSGAEWYGHGSEGLVVWSSNSSPYRKVSSGTLNAIGAAGIFPPTSQCLLHKWNGGDPPSQTDPTNYASTYSVDIIGKYVRKT